MILNAEPTEDNEAAGMEEGELMREIAEEMRSLGYENLEVSGGSTPTGLFVAKSGGVDEIRPGTYIFNDYMLWKENAAELSERFSAARLFYYLKEIGEAKLALSQNANMNLVLAKLTARLSTY